jgi:hypothetical protein
MDHRSRRRIGHGRRRRRIDRRGPRSSARKQSHSDSRCGRNSKDFAHSRSPPGRAGLSPRQKLSRRGYQKVTNQEPPSASSPREASRDVRFGSLADITARSRHVRFTPDSGHSSVQLECPTGANSGHSRQIRAPTPTDLGAECGRVIALLRSRFWAGLLVSLDARTAPLVRPRRILY